MKLSDVLAKMKTKWRHHSKVEYFFLDFALITYAERFLKGTHLKYAIQFEIEF